MPWSKPAEPWSREVGEGETPETALQEAHPEMSFGERFRIMTRGGDPAAGEKFLRERGWDAKSLGGSQYAVRRPGEAEYRLLDEPGASFQDITDVFGDVGSAAATIGGGILGSPGGVAGGAGGAALGAAGAQGLRTLLSGIPAGSPGEAIGEIGTEALIGGATQGVGSAIGGAARGLGRGAGSLAARGAAPVGGIAAGPTRMAGRLATAGKALQGPQRALEGMLGFGSERTLAKSLGRRALMGGGLMAGGPLGGGVAAAGIGGLVGRGLGRASKVLMEDTSGRPLVHLLNRATGPIAQKIERVLSMAGQEGATRSYKAAIWSLLHDPDFRALLNEGPESGE